MKRIILCAALAVLLHADDGDERIRQTINTICTDNACIPESDVAYVYAQKTFSTAILLAQLRDNSHHERWAPTLFWLGRLGPYADPGISALIAIRAHDENIEISYRAYEALGALAKAGDNAAKQALSLELYRLANLMSAVKKSEDYSLLKQLLEIIRLPDGK